MITKRLVQIIVICQSFSLLQAMNYDTSHSPKRIDSALHTLSKQMKSTATDNLDKASCIKTIMDNNFARNAYGLFIGELTEPELHQLPDEQLALLSNIATAPARHVFSIESEQELEHLYHAMLALGARPRWFFNRYQFRPQAQQHPLYRAACTEIIMHYAQREQISLTPTDFAPLTLEQINLLYKLSGYPDYCNRYNLNEQERNTYATLPEKFTSGELFDASQLPQQRQGLIALIRSLLC